MAAFRIDPTSPVPVFRQIVEGLRASIAAGVYRPGERLPSVRQQAVTLLVNPNTVQRAYETMEREGLVESRRGIGMTVADDAGPVAARGAEQDAAEAFASAVDRARAAGLGRERIDVLYRRAWRSANRARIDGGV